MTGRDTWEEIHGRGELAVVGEAAVTRALDDAGQEVVSWVAEAYRGFGDGRFTCPPSTFLHFPDPTNRIIGLPARLGDPHHVAGLKWVSSFPGNRDRGWPRASALQLINDAQTGHVIACVEATAISAARTAASAALAANLLWKAPSASVGFIGTGPIARTILAYLSSSPLKIGQVSAYDLVTDHAAAFLEAVPDITPTHLADSVAEVVPNTDIVVFATTASSPHVGSEVGFRPGQLVLHVSLRDLAPEVILDANNVVDSLPHCQREKTSTALAEEVAGHHDFVNAEIHEVLDGKEVARDRPIIFSPFGLGVLDLYLAWQLLHQGRMTGSRQQFSGPYVEFRDA